jgi:hypothetical protein
MRALWIGMLALAALGLATTAAAPSVARADKTGAGGEVAASATQWRSASPTTPPPATTAAPWWGSAVDVTPKPWWRGTGEEPWRFNAAVYGWLPNAPVEINLGPVDSTLPEDLGTLVDALEYAIELNLEARKGRFGGYVAPLFGGLSAAEDVQGPIQEHRAKLEEFLYLIDFGLSYEIGQWPLWNRPDWILASPAVTVEPYVGARWLLDNISINIDPPGRDFEPQIKFITPVIGLRTIWDLTDRFNLRFEGDYGGFDVDHVKRTYDVVGLLGYRFKPLEKLNINVFAGYRYLYLHYEKVAEIELTAKGAIVGLAFEFAANGSGFVSP